MALASSIVATADPGATSAWDDSNHPQHCVHRFPLIALRIAPWV
jgi:hypothetical protein